MTDRVAGSRDPRIGGNPVGVGPGDDTPIQGQPPPVSTRTPPSTDSFATDGSRRGAATTGAASTTPSVSNLPRISGTVTTPAVVLRPADVFSRLDQGTLRVTVPMKPQDLGLVSVRPGTQAEVELAIRDGKIDRERTQIYFVDEKGERTDLDGPLWWDGKRIYIDDDGSIRAEVPCFPDPDITDKVMPASYDRNNTDAGHFIACLAEKANNPQLELAPERQIVGTHTLPEVARAAGRVLGTTDATADASDVPAGAVPTAGAASATTPAAAQSIATPPAPAAAPAPAKGPGEQLADALDLANLKVGFVGTFKAGPMRLGDGTTVNLAPGARVEVTGSTRDLLVDVQAPVRDMRMSAQGTTITSGPGDVAFALRLRNDVDAAGVPTPVATDLAFTELDLRNLTFETPADGDARHRLGVGHVKVDSDARAPLLRVRGRDGQSTLQLDIPEIEMQDVTGTFVSRGTDGAPAEITLGRRRPGESPTNVRASLRIDSGAHTFAFDSHTESLHAGVGRLALVDAPDFDMELERAELSGSGRFAVHRADGKTRVGLHADEGTEWTVEAALRDAKIGADSDNAPMMVDLAATTGGQIRLSHLEFGDAQHPVFSGAADFQVQLDGLRLPLGSNQGVELRPGTVGTLRIKNMQWAAADASPTVDAELRLEVGAEVVVSPGKIPGLEGGRVEVDVETGKTVIVLTAKLDREGNLVADCGVTLSGVELATRMSRGEVPGEAPTAVLSERPLGPYVAPRLHTVRTPTPPPPRAAPTPIASPKLPPLTINPADLVGRVDDTTVTLTVPVDPIVGMSARLQDSYVLNRGRLFDTESGTRVDAVFNRGSTAAGAQPVSLVLDVQNGSIAPDTSVLNVDPPLTIDLTGTYFGTAPDVSTSATVTVRRLVVMKDANGDGYLWPDIDLDGLVPWGMRQLGLEDLVKRVVGNQLSVMLLGQSTFPLKLDDFMKTLGGRIPAVGTDIVIRPELPGIPDAATPTTTGGGSQPASGGAPPATSGNPAASAGPRGGSASGGSAPAPAPAAGAGGGAPSSGTPLPPITIPSTGNAGLDAIIGRVRVERATVDMPRATFNPGVIDLGNGQRIELAEGTALSFKGSLDEWEISGDAVLGAVRLGGGDAEASLAGGTARLVVKMKRGRDGTPRITVEITELAATGISAIGRTGGARVRLHDAAVGQQGHDRGQLSLAVGGGEPTRFAVRLPDTSAKLTAAGAGTALDYSAGADRAIGTVSGTLELVDGALAGELSAIDLDATGISFRSGGSTAGEIGRLRFSGATRIRTDAEGLIHFEAIDTLSSRGLKLDTDVTFNDGAKVTIVGGSARQVVLGLGTQPSLELTGMQADDVSVLVPLQGEEGRPRILDIRRARIAPAPDDPNAGLRFDGNGVRTLGQLAVSGVSGSVTNLARIATDHTTVPIDQMDFSGDGLLKLNRDGGWSIRSFPRADGRSSIRTTARAGDARVRTTSPEIDFDLHRGATLTADLGSLEVAPNGLRFDVSHAELEGVLDRGTVTTAPKGSIVEALTIKEGARVRAELPYFAIATGELSPNKPQPDVDFSASMYLEGEIENRFERLAPVDVQEQRFEIESAEVDGRFRLAVGLRMRNGDFAANSRARIDGRLGARVRSRVDVPNALERFRRRAAETPNEDPAESVAPTPPRR